MLFVALFAIYPIEFAYVMYTAHYENKYHPYRTTDSNVKRGKYLRITSHQQNYSRRSCTAGWGEREKCDGMYGRGAENDSDLNSRISVNAASCSTLLINYVLGAYSRNALRGD